jgi:HlyD family secretion protein
LEEEKEIELRSDEVQEVLTEVPNWMIRYGITLIFAIILSILALSWFIKYPEVIPGAAELTTKSPPAILVANTSGYIRHIYHDENDSVQAGQLIAELTNPVDQNVIDSLRIFLSSFDLEKSEQYMNRLSRIKEIGTAQGALNGLYNQLSEYNQLINDESFQRTINGLRDQVAYNTRLVQLTREQTKLFQAEMEAAQEKFASDSILYEDGVIAKMTFYNNQSEYFAKNQTLLEAKKAAIQYKVAASDFAEQKNILVQSQEDRKRTLTAEIESSLKLIKAFADDWKLNYTITSPIAGQLAYFDNLTENEFVKTEQPLFTVIPDNDEVLGIVQIDQQGYGKIIIGQEVRIKLDNYPFQEYGQLKGRVENISKISGENGYTLKVEFEDGMKTTYNQKIDYQPGMSGTAEIVTEDLRLIERIFNSIREIFDR